MNKVYVFLTFLLFALSSCTLLVGKNDIFVPAPNNPLVGNWKTNRGSDELTLQLSVNDSTQNNVKFVTGQLFTESCKTVFAGDVSGSFSDNRLVVKYVPTNSCVIGLFSYTGIFKFEFNADTKTLTGTFELSSFPGIPVNLQFFKVPAN